MNTKEHSDISDPIRIVLADDHAIVRQGLQALLGVMPDLCVVAEAATGEEAVVLCAEHVPDVVLMDLVMPGMDGVEATRRIKQISPRTQIMILTSYHEEEHLLPAVRAGALSYLLKDVPPADLVIAVRRAARGEATLHPRMAAQIVRLLHQPGTSSDKRATGMVLTPREHEVLRGVAEGRANAQIANLLFISEKTVKFHVSNILSKLQLADRTQAAVYAWREGLMKDAPPQPPAPYLERKE